MTKGLWICLLTILMVACGGSPTGSAPEATGTSAEALAEPSAAATERGASQEAAERGASQPERGASQETLPSAERSSAEPSSVEPERPNVARPATSPALVGSTTTVISSVNPSAVGQTVTFAATVTGSGGTPTGIVQFFDGASKIGSDTLDANGTAALSDPNLSLGTHSITARYQGDSTFSASTSAVLSQQVGQAATTLSLTSGVNPSVVNGAVTFTAMVSLSTPRPSGTVTFFDGATALGMSPVTTGPETATLTTSSLAIGSHTVTAVYSGDSNYAASTSSAVTQVVTQDTEAIVLTSSANPSDYGTSVTFSAKLTSTSTGGVPTGMVTFQDSGNAIGSGTIDGTGTATFATATLTAGTHSITASYGGDTNHVSGVSNTLSQVVNMVASTTSLVSATNPSVFGQSVTFMATVPSAATGTVTFLDGATPLGTTTVSAGIATFSTTALAVGTHPITAAYSGDTNFAGSTSAALSQVVNMANTTTAVISSSNPSSFGSSVTFTASVMAVAPGAGTPDGTVTFFDGTTALGAAVALSSGAATFSTSALAVGSHSITAQYSGSASFNASASSALTQTVGLDAVTMTLASSSNPSTYGSSVTFTAVVSTAAPGGTATGTVTFNAGSTALGTGTLDGTGTATFSTSSLPGGSTSITAVYGGDSTHASGSSAALLQVVNPAASSVALSSSENPSIFGQSVTFTANVTSSVAGTLTGTVNFIDGSTLLGGVTLTASGTVTYSTTALAVGSHAITAVYSGDSNYATSTSTTVTQVVNQATTSSVVVSSANPSSLGATVIFTDTVIPGQSGSSAPTGSVTFMDGTTTLGVATLDAHGQATLSVSTLTVGTHPISAAYGGDANFLGDTSPALAQVVRASSVAASLKSAPNPAQYSQAVTFLATIDGDAGAPTGIVTFTDPSFDGGAEAGSTLGTGAIDGGVATFTISDLSVGTHTVTATYGGDETYGSQTASVAEIVTKADAGTALASSENPSAVGDTVTFTATVTSTAPGATGSVLFNDGTTAIGSGTLSGAGTATLAVSNLTQGGHVITAVYGGDSTHVASSSAPLTQTVNAVGEDGGTDSGAPDGGSPDASIDAGGDAGLEDGGSSSGSPSGGGCGCRTTSSEGPSGLELLPLAGIILLGARRLRRRA